MPPLYRKLPQRASPLGGGGWGEGEQGSSPSGELSVVRQSFSTPRQEGMKQTRALARNGEKRCFCGTAGSRGFSLIELLVVLLLLGVMAGVAGPAVGRFLDSMEFKRQTGKIMAAVRYARLQAITEGRLVLMTASAEGGPPALALSGGVSEFRELDLAEDATIELDPVELGFSPEGYATPGLIILTQGERTESIFIDPLTGIPLLEDPDSE